MLCVCVCVNAIHPSIALLASNSKMVIYVQFHFSGQQHRHHHARIHSRPRGFWIHFFFHLCALPASLLYKLRQTNEEKEMKERKKNTLAVSKQIVNAHRALCIKATEAEAHTDPTTTIQKRQSVLLLAFFLNELRGEGAHRQYMYTDGILKLVHCTQR